MKRSEDEKPSYLGHRARIKARYKARGLDGWADYEVLEFALSYAVPRKDTKPLAKRLIERFETLQGVLDADTRDLRAVKGLTDHGILFFSLLKDISKLYLKETLSGKDVVSSPEAVVRYFRASLQGLADEEFQALFLTSANRVITAETLQAGTVNRSSVYPRKIVERALSLHATGIIIAHNHPGGVLKPSNEDTFATEAVRQALKTVDVSLLDHIIISRNGYFSWKEHGML